MAKTVVIYLKLLPAPMLLVCCADIPYYQYFNSRLTSSVHLWLDNLPQMLGFLFATPEFYPFIAAFIIVSALLIILIGKVANGLLSSGNVSNNRVVHYASPLLAAGLLLVGMRGGAQNRPIVLKDGFFSNSAFINQLCLNPVWTYLDSFKFFTLNYFSNEVDAIAEVRLNLRIPETGGFKSPIARRTDNLDAGQKKNVVLVLMESMSADQMGVFGNPRHLTPFLDSLSTQSLFFKNFYSCGIHTCNGIFGTLYGFPTLMADHPLMNIQNLRLHFSGLPQTLSDRGYTNLFFCTHDPKFDNLGTFIPRNGFHRLYSIKDYPPQENLGEWGVSDEFLFKYALPKIDSLHMAGKPFFTTLLTISTHPPEFLPPNTSFKPKSKIIRDHVFEYADWAIAGFMKQCATKPWYNNTVFVFLGDHGINLLESNTQGKYAAPLSLNHIPFILFEPSNPAMKETRETFGSQIDVFPTVAHMLGIDYVNNTLGVDIIAEAKPQCFFTQDNKLSVISADYYLVIDKSGNESFYCIGGKKISPAEQENQIAAFKRYAYSMLQTTQVMQDRAMVEIGKGL